MMNVKIITVPVVNPDEKMAELNQFLNSHRIIATQKECVVQDGIAYWTFVIDHQIAGAPVDYKKMGQRKSTIDYKTVLSEADFVIYAKIRELRNRIAEAEGKPPFALFNNAQ